MILTHVGGTSTLEFADSDLDDEGEAEKITKEILQGWSAEEVLDYLQDMHGITTVESPL